ncbi:MAG: zf-HC2 domain-containing protein, partial [Lachnospiraceae bacterium]|nr:zf-HC2 domain-containing protein [Lachnospiraceae bacterium]
TMSDLSCTIIRDLLPTYVDGLTGDDSNKAIEAHLSNCPECREIYESMSGTEEMLPDQDDETELDFLKKQRKKQRRLLLPIPVMAVLFLVGSLFYIKSQEVKFDFQEFAAGANRGDTFSFGTYEQDGDLTNGPEDIVWIVLTNRNHQLLAISKYGLDHKPYHEEDVPVTWENCTLRQWLNTDFYDTAFSEKDKSLIAVSELNNWKNPYYDTDGGVPTEDKVFLLSEKEAEALTMDISTGISTSFGKQSGVIIDVQTGHCEWWLRTAGIREGTACRTGFNGYADAIGTKVNCPGLAVRPCILIEY